MNNSLEKNNFNVEPFSNIIQNIPIGILLFTSDWKIYFVNENFYQFGSLYQINTSSLIENNILQYKLFPSCDISEELKKLEEGYSFETEVADIKTKNGRISVVVKGSPLFESGIFAGGILIVEDLKIIDKKIDENEITTEQFEKALSRLNNILLITDPKGKIKYSFGKNIPQLNLTSSESHEADLSVDRIFDQEIHNEFKEKFEAARDQKITGKCKVELIFNEDIYYYNCMIEPISDGGEIQYIFIWLNDVSEIVNSEKALKRELNKLRQYKYIIDSSTDPIFIIDEDGNINFWTGPAEEMFGFSKEDIIGEFLGQIFKFDFNDIKSHLKLSNTWEGELRAVTKNNTEKIIYTRFRLSEETDNNILVICTDITEKTFAEQQLRNSENKFKNIFYSAENPACILNAEGYITDANKNFISELKYSQEDLLNRNIRNIIAPDFIRETSFELKSHLNAPKSDIPFITGEDEKIVYLSRFIPVYDKDGKITTVNCYFEDVTKESVNEEEKRFFNSVFEYSPEGVAVESGGRIIHANQMLANIFCYESQKELVNKDLLDLVENNDVIKIAEYFQLIEKKKTGLGRLEFTGKQKDNSNFYAEITASPFELNRKIFTVLIIRDITERKKAQSAITDSEEKYRNIIESIDDFLYTYEKINNVLKPVFFTSSVEKITGYTQQNFLNDSRLLIKIIHPNDLLLVKQKIRVLFNSRILNSEEIEFRIINKSGNIVWVRNKVNVVRGISGKIQKVYGLINNISLRKKAEEDLIRTTENLVKLNETKDKFISIVSHDLRTPFSSILGFTDLLLNDEELTEEEKNQYISFIRDSSKSMLSLVNSLLDWTRLQTGRISIDLERVDANSIIEKSINALSGAAFQKNIELTTLVGNDVFIFIDKELIGQVFNNLISNAIKFTKEGGNIIISVNPSEKPRFVEFSVKDNGIGIKEENLKYLFKVESKFTSEGTSGEKGSGLGLSLVKEIIEKHGGKIWVETEYGEGSNFRFTLPIASADILLVDDSKTDKLLYSKILKNITPDYNVKTASNGNDAMEIIKNSPPALIITDHNMPIMNGYELIQALKKSNIKSKPPVIVLSGDITHNEMDDYSRIGVEFVFHKPVDLSLFKRAVEKSLKVGLKS